MNYRKKPVVIEAELFDPVHLDLPFKGRGDPCCLDPGSGQWYIETLEGKHRCTSGDMIIRGVKGEFYSCKPDIFAATYEAESAPLPGNGGLRLPAYHVVDVWKITPLAPRCAMMNEAVSKLRAALAPRKEGEG